MLLEIAIGDSYGAGFEFAPAHKVKAHNTLTHYSSHGSGIPPGSYTDDTQMSIALAELLVEDREWTSENIAQAFVNCFKRDERLGYAKGFLSFLKSITSGEEFLKKVRPESTRNGACMRAAPLGVLTDIDQLLEYAEIQARVTHNTEIGIKSAQAAALSAHYFLNDIGEKKICFTSSMSIRK